MKKSSNPIFQASSDYMLTKGFLLLFIIVVAYVIMIIQNYLLMPSFSDNLWYVQVADQPDMSTKLFFRFFNYYICIITTFFFENSLKSCVIYSLFCYTGTIVISYAIVQKVAGRTSAIIASILIATCPVMLYEATIYGPDVPCLFYGLISLYFSLWIPSDKEYRRVKLFISGFFLIGCIFSKTTGIAFIIPIVINLVPNQTKQKWLYFAFGGIGTFIFLSICDKIWMNNFFYHINPGNYILYLNVFDTNLSGYIERSLGIHWKDTFFTNFVNYSYVHYLIFLSVFLTLFCGNDKKEITGKRYLSISIFLVAVLSLFIHESVHVKNTLLKIHYRWIYTVLIPIIISFCCMLPTSKAHKDEDDSTFYFLIDFALIMFFLIFFFISKREITFQNELQTSWQFYNSIIHVFSFWFFLIGMAIFLFFQNKAIFSINLKWNRIHKCIGYFGIVIIIWYCTVWGHIGAFQMHKGYYKYWNQLEGGFGKFFKNIPENVLIINVGKTKIVEDRFKYLYLNRDISKSRYSEIEEFRRMKNPDPFEHLNDNTYEFILTEMSLNELNDRGIKYGFQFKEITKIKNLYYYKIIKIIK